MSTEALDLQDQEYYRWDKGFCPGDYLVATYDISTRMDPFLAALGMAREQSASSVRHPCLGEPRRLQGYTARVIDVVETGEGTEVVSPYFLATPVYGRPSGENPPRAARIRIAYAAADTAPSLVRILNQVFGELPRLGYLCSLRIVDIDFPDWVMKAFPGPGRGMGGIREMLGEPHSPIFCRSLLPAVGLDTPSMARIHETVLTGGFHAVKDDELTHNTNLSPFRERVRAIVAMKKRVEDKTGRRKLYFANVIDDLGQSLEMAGIAAEEGADGLVVSASLQGFSILGEMARRTGLLILSHNSGGDHFTRHTAWGISEPLFAKLQRLAGADFVITPGFFASGEPGGQERKFVHAACGPLGPIRSALPIIMGGKRADQLQDYISHVGSTDFMIIAATWVDRYPGGPEAGARAFVEAWEKISPRKETVPAASLER
jgi:ribulose-bisphosphate carboxylase large chain